MRTITATIAVLLTLAALAAADTVILKNGSKIEGRIVKETDDQVVVQVPGVGKLVVDRDRITEIRRDGRGTAEPPPRRTGPTKPTKPKKPRRRGG
jgi:hypothetical protein